MCKTLFTVQKIVKDVQAKAPENVQVKCGSGGWINKLEVYLYCYDKNSGKKLSSKDGTKDKLYEWVNSDACQRNELDKRFVFYKPISQK